MIHEPTEMELRVLLAISEYHSGNAEEGMKITRAAIRAMQWKFREDCPIHANKEQG